MIGSEGDFAPEEIKAALDAGWKPVALHRNVCVPKRRLCGLSTLSIYSTNTVQSQIIQKYEINKTIG